MKARIAMLIASIALGALLMPLQPGAQEASGSWRPFIRDKKGVEKAFPDDPGKVTDREWLNLGYPEFTGGFKPRLGVVFADDNAQQDLGPIQNETLRVLVALSQRDEPEENTTIPASHVEDMVRQALSTTGRFTMLERTTATEDVLQEQDLGASGRVDGKTAAAIGKLKGADYIVKAAIIEINPEKESKDIKLAGGALGGKTLGLGSVGTSGKVAFCRVSVRLVNATTGVVVQDMIVDGTATSKDVNIGGGLLKGVTGGLVGGGGGFSKKEDTVISNAIQACANKVAYYTATQLGSLPWEGAVVAAQPISINAGKNIGLVPGLELKLFSKGEELLDEDGSSLGFSRRQIGRVRIAECQEKFSVCEIVEGGQGVKKGDIVQLEMRN